jgi:hypothetical protein
VAATLATSGVTAATYGSTTQVPVIAVDAKGRITSASNATIASAPAWATYHPDTPPASPTTFGGTVYDQEFVRDNALAAASTVLGAPATSPSIVDRALRVVSGTSGSADVKGVEWACPSGAFTMTAKLRRKFHTATFGNFGIMLRRNGSGAGNFVNAMSNMSATNNASFAVDKYTTETNRSSFGSGSRIDTAIWRPLYLRWVYDGTNIKASISFTGYEDTFFQFFSETAATFLGGAPGRYGVIIDNFGTAAANTGYCEWIRFT